MTQRYKLSKVADRDLDEIWLYIAQNSVDAADACVLKLSDAFERIARTPGLGHRREEITSANVLFWSVGDYLIAYRPLQPRVEIVTVVHGARNLKHLLKLRT